jgi:hypothetical protein
MSIYRDEADSGQVGSKDKLEKIHAGCPICKGDVLGDDVYLFYCQKCNILFKREEVLHDTPEQIDFVMKQKIAEKYDDDKHMLKMPDMEPIKIKVIDDKKKNLLNEHKERKKTYYYASKQSNILHVGNCLYGKNIKKTNRIVFHNLSEARNYKKCRCVPE